MRRKIGILGGTFDPFHKGHFMLAETAYKQFALDEIWIMPNGNPPHKKDTEQTDFEIRCEMVKLAIMDSPYMKLCKVEESEASYHYTYETLGKFKEKYPTVDFYFIIGADSLNDFPKWREPGVIAKLCKLLVACRDETGIQELKNKATEIEDMYGGEVLIMNSPKVDAASSEIRKMIFEGKDISGYVDQKICDYIQEQKLYKAV